MGSCIQKQQKVQTIQSLKIYPQTQQCQNQVNKNKSQVNINQQLRSQSQLCISMDGNLSQRLQNQKSRSNIQNSSHIIQKEVKRQQNKNNQVQQINGNIRQTSIKVKGKDRICGLTVVRQGSNDDDFSKISKLSMIDNNFIDNNVVQKKLRGTQIMIRQSQQQDQNITKTIR